MNWLFKEEPTHYSYDDLVAMARPRGPASESRQKHLRAVAKAIGSFSITWATKGGGRHRESSGAVVSDPADTDGNSTPLTSCPSKKLSRP
jgi:hypothetical protein